MLVVEVVEVKMRQEDLAVTAVAVQVEQLVLEIQVVLTLEVEAVVELEMVVQVIRVEQVDQE
jgi:hypothetical protein